MRCLRWSACSAVGKQLGPNYLRLAPTLATLPMPGDLTSVNIESLLGLHPQVVFVANYAPPEMIAQIERAGIPVVAISLRREAADQAGKMNPQLSDEDRAYTLGLQDGIRLIGEVMSRQPQAEALIKDVIQQRALVAERLRDLPENQRVRVYMANPDLTTYGAGKYTGLMMRHAGALNVAAKDIQGFKQVSIEDVLKWDPAVIFVQERYPDVVQQILTSPQWQPIDAVKNKRVYLMPEYAKAWGIRCRRRWRWVSCGWRKTLPAAFCRYQSAAAGRRLLSTLLPRHLLPELAMRLGWLALLTLCCALFSLGVGRFQVPMTHSLMILLEPFTGQHYAGIDAIQRQVILGVRVPRVLLAMGAGAALALCGAALQGVFRNPLVDPHIVGVSSGAAWRHAGYPAQPAVGGAAAVGFCFRHGGAAADFHSPAPLRGAIFSLVLAG